MKRFVIPALLLCLGFWIPKEAQAKPADAPAIDPPRLILIIRHAEKPDSDDDIHLSARGKERAEALVKSIPENFAKPDFIFAAHKSAKSDRSVETVSPLAKAINLEVSAAFEDEEYKKLAKQILSDPRYSNKIILICWHHGKIPELAAALGAKKPPAEWDKKIFDRVWQIKFKEGKAKWNDLPQTTLPGDSHE
jgi:broad specificity phosphatase PhoE